MAGRGRARGRARDLSEQAPTSPGGLVLRNNTEDIDIKEDVYMNGEADSQPSPPASDKSPLSLADIKAILENPKSYSEEHDVKRVLICAKNFVRTESDVKNLAEIIYTRCLEDYTRAKKGAEMIDVLSVIEVGNIKFRSYFLSLVQNDYKNRKDMMVKEQQKFLGFLSLLCNIFGSMRTATSEVFKPLIDPIYDCLNLILNPYYVKEDEEDGETVIAEEPVNEDACEVFAQELLALGKLLDSSNCDRMHYLIANIRSCIINSCSTPRVRCSLLEVIESYARGWEAANNETTRYYCDMSVNIISGQFV